MPVMRKQRNVRNYKKRNNDLSHKYYRICQKIESKHGIHTTFHVVMILRTWLNNFSDD